MNANLISISGIDGSGKSTQLDLLKKYEDLGFKVVYLWSRGGSTSGINKLKIFFKADAARTYLHLGKAKKEMKCLKIFLYNIFGYMQLFLIC